MLAILRQVPGEQALTPGTYALVDHFGEPQGYSEWFEKGQRLPLAVAAADGPLWWVLVDLSTEATEAA